MTATAYSSPNRLSPIGSGIAAAVLILLAAASSGCSGESENPINVVIHFPGPTRTLSRAELSVDYSRSGARPAGGKRPACTVLIPSVDASFTDDGKGRLSIDVNSPRGFSAPVDLVACRMIASGPSVDPARVQTRLKVELRSATALDGDELNEKQLSGLSSRIRTRFSTTGLPTRTGEGRQNPLRPAESRSGRDSAGNRPSPAVSSRSRADSRSQRNDRRAGQASAYPFGNSRRPLDSIENSRLEQPPAGAIPPVGSDPRPESGFGGTYGASPGLPNILSTDNPGLGDSSGAAGANNGGAFGGAVGAVDPSTSLPTHDYEITISVLSSSGDLGALQIDVDFVGGSGGFVGRGSSVACTNLAAGAMVAFNRQNQGIKAGFIALNGLATPGPVASCKFKSRENVTVQSFSVQVADASGTADSKPLNPPPFVAVNDVRLLN